MLVHGAAAAILNYQGEVVRMRHLQDSGTVLFMRGQRHHTELYSDQVDVEMNTDSSQSDGTNIKYDTSYLVPSGSNPDSYSIGYYHELQMTEGECISEMPSREHSGLPSLISVSRTEMVPA